MAEYIKLEDAIAVIEEKQKELCPVGRYGRGYVYGSDREKYDSLDEIIDALQNIPNADMDASLSSVDEDTILDLVDSVPTADVAPIEALKRLRDELYEQELITMEGLKRLNALIGECVQAREGG